MDDDERYPPNSHHPRGHFSSSSSSFARPNRIPPPQISRLYPPALDEDEDDDDANGANGLSRPVDEDNDDEDDDGDGDNEAAGGGGGGAYRHVTADGRGSRRDEDDDYSSSGSSESRGKRRKIDRNALGFEFAPRLPPQAVAPAKPPARSSTTDWSEDATFVLLDAWGNRYVQNGRKSIRSDEWSEVAKIVSQASNVSRSDGQCRNRVDTLKKKYKKEKTRLATGHHDSTSKWIFFQRMDALMSPPSPPPPPPPSIGRQRQHHQSPKLACGVDAGEYVFAGYQNRVNGNDEMKDSPGDTGTEDDGDDGEDDSEGLPPSRKNASRTSDSSFRMLADSIQKFGEIYEKMENSKRQQMAELEQMRKEFHRDLELQKKQILERAQAEIAKLREEEGAEGDDEDEDDDDDDDGHNSGSADNLSGFVIGSLYLTAFG